MPAFGLEGATSILAEIMSIFSPFFSTYSCIMHVTHGRQTAQQTSAERVRQLAGYKFVFLVY